MGSSLALPANGLGGSRATSLLVTHFALQNTKFGSEKGKVQNPARIPPQTPPAGGKKAEAGQFHPPQKNSLPRRVQISFQDFRQKKFELPHCRPRFVFGFQKCLQNCGKIPCRGALRRGNIFQFR